MTIWFVPRRLTRLVLPLAVPVAISLSMAGNVVPRAAGAQESVAATTASDRAVRTLDELLAHPVTIDVTRAALKRVIDLLSASAKVPVQYDEHVIDGYKTPITLRLRNVPLRVAFERILSGTTLTVVPDGTSRLALITVKGTDGTRGPGEIIGTVTNAKTRLPLHGVSVWIDDSSHMVRTDDKGAFRFTGVAAGTHRITARYIGFARQTRVATVEEDQTVAVEFASFTEIWLTVFSLRAL